MIAPNNNEQPDPAGGLGGTALRPRGIRDTRLIERALRQGWPIPQKRRKAITQRQCDIAEDPESSPREATSAARCLAMMSAENASIALKLLDKVIPDQHHYEHSTDGIAIQDLLTHADYVNYLRHRTVHEDCDAGAVCQIREPGYG